jgi:4-amino-4-deoxy-L-arabinose transferase-like glycosyltransferase
VPRTGIVLGLLALLLWFGNLDYRKLIKTDEGRYAEIAREMMASGDWVTPRLNGFKYFYKPPLQYWATASAFTAFGPNEWTARLWTALTGAAAALFAGFAAARLWTPAVGLAAALALLGSVYWVAMGHFAALDMSLAAFLSAAIFAFVLAQRDGIAVRARRGWMIVTWACAALALMSKGLIGIVLPAGALAAYMLWERDWRLLARLHWWSGLAVFLALTVPWFVLVLLRNPEFAEFFFIREHVTRFLTKVHGRYGPWWYFIPHLVLGVFPFALALWGGVKAGWTRRAGHFQPQRCLLAWSMVVFVFFSASSSKLPSYILPIIPALVVLAVVGLSNASRRALLWHWGFVALCGALIAAIAPFAITRARSTDIQPLLGSYLPWIVAAGIVFAATGLAAAALAWRTKVLASIACVGIGSLAATQLIVSGHESLAPVYSSYHIAQKTRPELTPDTRLFAVDTYDHTLPFYLGRTLTMVAYKDELAPSIAWEPERFLQTYDAFEREWHAAPRAIALMDPREFATFEARRLPMAVVARDARRVIVKKP